MNEERKKTIKVISVLIIGFILLPIGVMAVLAPEIFNIGPKPPELTIVFQNVTIGEAKELINTTNLTIIDVRGLEGCGSCQFKKGHLPNAVRYDNPELLYNATNDILVYSVDGTIGFKFCECLMYHVYGDVYNLEGGWNAWTSYQHT